jgi:hypothetical protein
VTPRRHPKILRAMSDSVDTVYLEVGVVTDKSKQPTSLNLVDVRFSADEAAQ